MVLVLCTAFFLRRMVPLPPVRTLPASFFSLSTSCVRSVPGAAGGVGGAALARPTHAAGSCAAVAILQRRRDACTGGSSASARRVPERCNELNSIREHACPRSAGRSRPSGGVAVCTMQMEAAAPSALLTAPPGYQQPRTYHDIIVYGTRRLQVQPGLRDRKCGAVARTC